MTFLFFSPQSKIPLEKSYWHSPQPPYLWFQGASESVSSYLRWYQQKPGRLPRSSSILHPAGPLASQPSSVAVGMGQTLLSPSAAWNLKMLQFITVTSVTVGTHSDSTWYRNLCETFKCLFDAIVPSFVSSCCGDCSVLVSLPLFGNLKSSEKLLHGNVWAQIPWFFLTERTLSP